MSDSPLQEAAPDSLEDIFNKDPLKLTEQDIDATIAYFRNARGTFLKNEAEGKVTRTTKKAAPKTSLDPKLTLDDLDL